jgi:hypothetical protein
MASLRSVAFLPAPFCAICLRTHYRLLLLVLGLPRDLHSCGYGNLPGVHGLLQLPNAARPDLMSTLHGPSTDVELLGGLRLRQQSSNRPNCLRLKPASPLASSLWTRSPVLSREMTKTLPRTWPHSSGGSVASQGRRVRPFSLSIIPEKTTREACAEAQPYSLRAMPSSRSLQTGIFAKLRPRR